MAGFFLPKNLLVGLLITANKENCYFLNYD
jgi:hypothetical protein